MQYLAFYEPAYLLSNHKSIENHKNINNKNNRHHKEECLWEKFTTQKVFVM